MTKEVAPGLSDLQRRVSLNGVYPPVPSNINSTLFWLISLERCVVTGGTGFVGLRVVEMLVERGAEQVVALDIVGVDDLPQEVKKFIWKNPKIKYIQGDITKVADIERAFAGADCVWHIAAIVGPFHPTPVYHKVNVEGTKNVVEVCKKLKIAKIIMASTPSTRMNGSDIDGLNESQLPTFEQMQGKFLQVYAETKFIGEKYLLDACSEDLSTVAIAPHQVYGPRDNLFLPNFLEVAAVGRLRIFSKRATGYGLNKVCFTHVDNYAHGLIIAERALTKTSKCRGKFYIITDAETHPNPKGFAYLWEELDRMTVDLGFQSLKAKFKIPYWFIMPLAWMISFFSKGKSKLSPFTVTTLTMHRWFNTDAAKEDLGYTPLIGFREGWEDTTRWFKDTWLLHRLQKMKQAQKSLLSGVADTTVEKINIQSNASK